MKKVLFVMQAMGMGGSYTSLLNLLELMKEQGTTVDLFLMEHNGMFLERARETANLLPEDKVLGAIRCDRSRLHEYGLQGFAVRLMFTIGHRVIPADKLLAWIYRRRAARLTGYDVVVPYQEEIPTVFAQYIPADKKVAWCHSDFNRFSQGRSIDSQKKLYSCYQDIVCVSSDIRNSMIQALELPEDRVHLIYNTLPANWIHEQAKEPVQLKRDGKQFMLVSVGRFAPVKRFDRVIKAAVQLKADGVSFCWYLIGNGEEYENIKEQISTSEVSDCVYLTEALSNPYPYIAATDALVMTSESEGQPMVMNEALTLSVPVITTDFPSAREVVQDRVNGIIGANSAEGLVDAVEAYVSDSGLRKKLKAEASRFEYNNDNILQQVIKLLD